MIESKENITTFEIDLDNPPPLSAEEQAESDAIAAIPDSEIDYSDIPPQNIREEFYRPMKEMNTVRIDADILHWLRSQGKGYQTKINKALREVMIQSM